MAEVAIIVVLTLLVYAVPALYLRANPLRQQMRWDWAFFHARYRRRAVVLRRERADEQVSRMLEVGGLDEQLQEATRERALAEEALVQLDTD